MKRFITFLAVFGLLLAFSQNDVQAQSTDTHTVTVIVQPFSFIGPPNGGGGFGTLPDVEYTVNGKDATNVLVNSPNDVSATGALVGGMIQVTTGTFDLSYGTNSTNTQKVHVTADNVTEPFTIDIENASVTPFTPLPSSGSAGTASNLTDLNGTQQDLVTGITQGAGDLSFNYLLETNRFTAPDTYDRNVTFTITAN